jgi:non-histone protein 10
VKRPRKDISNPGAPGASTAAPTLSAATAPTNPSSTNPTEESPTRPGTESPGPRDGGWVEQTDYAFVNQSFATAPSNPGDANSPASFMTVLPVGGSSSATRNGKTPSRPSGSRARGGPKRPPNAYMM